MLGILDCLRVFGVEARRQNTGAALNPRGQMVRFGEPGQADITGTLPWGRRLEIEAKAPGKRPTAKQLDYLRRINESGGVGIWIDDPAELARILPKLIDGARVEIDGTGQQWLVTGESPGESPSPDRTNA
jgi:hypothetical protein